MNYTKGAGRDDGPTVASREEQIELTEEQVRALGAPVRDELLRAFVNFGPASVTEIAERLGRPPKSAYYQVRKMAEVGLLRKVGSRGSGPKEEALFDAVADRHLLREAGVSDEYRQGVTESVKAVLRTTVREFEEANLDPSLGPLVILRTSARLAPEHATRLAEMLAEAVSFAKEHDDPQARDRFGVTAVVAPIVRIGHKPKGSSGD